MQASLSKAEETAPVTHNNSNSCHDCGNSKRTRQCGHCGRKGHTEPKCWEKFPHLKREPEQKREKRQQEALVSNHQSFESQRIEQFCLLAMPNRSVRGSRHCRHCGKAGHVRSRCWKLYPEQRRAFYQRRKRLVSIGRPSETSSYSPPSPLMTLPDQLQSPPGNYFSRFSSPFHAFTQRLRGGCRKCSRPRCGACFCVKVIWC